MNTFLFYLKINLKENRIYYLIIFKFIHVYMFNLDFFKNNLLFLFLYGIIIDNLLISNQKLINFICKKFSQT